MSPPNTVRAWLLLPLLVVACGSSTPDAPDARLDRIKQQIREEFPDVEAITTEQLADWLSASGAETPTLLDVRAPAEYAVSHLQGAHRALTESEAIDALRGAKRDARVVVYCSVGYRSAQLARKLQKKGFTRVYNLEGSIFQWANEGRTVYRDARPTGKVHPYDAKWGKLLDPKLH